MRAKRKLNYRQRLAIARKKEIESRKWYQLYREFIDLLETDIDMDREISEIEKLEYDAFDPTR